MNNKFIIVQDDDCDSHDSDEELEQLQVKTNSLYKRLSTGSRGVTNTIFAGNRMKSCII